VNYFFSFCVGGDSFSIHAIRLGFGGDCFIGLGFGGGVALVWWADMLNTHVDLYDE
jgi:hypothetical protein